MELATTAHCPKRWMPGNDSPSSYVFPRALILAAPHEQQSDRCSLTILYDWPTVVSYSEADKPPESCSWYEYCRLMRGTVICRRCGHRDVVICEDHADYLLQAVTDTRFETRVYCTRMEKRHEIIGLEELSVVERD